MNKTLVVMLILASMCNGGLQADDSETSRMLDSSTQTSQATPIKTERLMLRTRDGYYLRAKLGGGDEVVADIRDPKTSEVFTLEWLSSTRIRLRTRDGHYVGARLGGGDTVDATVKEPLTSEVFTVEWQDESQTRLRLRTREGFYVHPVGGGGGKVDARIRTPQTSEVFTLEAARQK